MIKIGVLEIVRFVMSRAICPYQYNFISHIPDVLLEFKTHNKTTSLFNFSSQYCLLYYLLFILCVDSSIILLIILCFKFRWDIRYAWYEIV